MNTLERQLSDYGEYQKELHGPIDFDRLASPAVFEPQRDAKRTNRVWVAFATAASVAVLVGSVPFISRMTGSESPAETSPVSTVVTPSTGVTIQPGSRLAFVAVDLPAGDPQFLDSAWHDGVLYATTVRGDIYSSVDGFDWKVETQFDRFRPAGTSAGTFRFNDVMTDGERLVVVGETDHALRNGDGCSMPGHLLRVIVVNPDGSTTSSDVPTPPPLIDADCVSINLGVTVGRLGVVVSGSIATHPPAFSERAVGLFSADGLGWTDLGRVPPFHSAQVEQVVAAPGRFFALPQGPDVDGPIYGSEDGLTWEVADEIDVDGMRSVGQWAGTTVMRGSTGIVALDRPGDVLVDADDLPKFSRLFFGQMGILGTGTGGYGNDVPTDTPFSFSVDGATWEHWTPAEFEGLDTMLGLVGMGDTFIVFNDWEGQRLWVGTPTMPADSPQIPTTSIGASPATTLALLPAAAEAPQENQSSLETTIFEGVDTGAGVMTWTLVTGDISSLPRAHPYGIETDGRGGFYATDPDRGLWTSRDGVSWSVDPTYTDFDVLGVEQTAGIWGLARRVDDSFSIVERRSNAWTEAALPEPIVWTGELDLPDPVPVQSGDRVLIPDTLTGTAWLSVAGAPFTAVQAPEPIISVVPLPTGGFALYTGTSNPDNVTAIHYTSLDGVTWSVQDPLPFVTADVIEYEVVRSGDTLVALLAKEQRCSVWHSDDGIVWIEAYDYANALSECWDHTGFGITALASPTRGRQVSTDNAQTWFWIEPPVDIGLNDGGGIVGSTGDVLYLIGDRDGARQLWIGRFDAP